MIPFFETLFDNNNKPLHGRVTFFNADTTDVATIWRWLSYQQQFIEADNPQYTTLDGTLQNTVFIEGKLYTVKQERYLGDYIDPSTDDRPNMWATDKIYYAGMDNSSGAGGSANVVYGMNALRNVEPLEDMVINVVGYNSSDDCPMRQYIWKANSSATVDNGTVIDSDITTGGRWILLTDLTYIPSEYFGVDSSHMNNMNALLQFRTTVEGYTYPNAIKFKTGHYEYLLPLNTSHDVIVDGESKFETSQFTCGKFTVLGDKDTRNTYIGNFVPSIDCEVRTSWFKNTNPMRFCTAATHFIVDGFFGTDDLVQDEYLVNEIVIGNPGDVSSHLKRMSTVMINGGNIIADNQILASGYYLSNGLRMAQSGNGAYVMPLGNLTPAIRINKGAGFDASEVDIPRLSSDNISANTISALTGNINIISTSGQQFTNTFGFVQDPSLGTGSLLFANSADRICTMASSGVSANKFVGLSELKEQIFEYENVIVANVTLRQNHPYYFRLINSTEETGLKLTLHITSSLLFFDLYYSNIKNEIMMYNVMYSQGHVYVTRMDRIA